MPGFPDSVTIALAPEMQVEQTKLRESGYCTMAWRGDDVKRWRDKH